MTRRSPALVDAVRRAPIAVDVTRDGFVAFLSARPPWSEAHVTAVAWVVDSDCTEVLLVEHRLHGWSCPGGHVVRREPPRVAAVRELYEETGISAPRPTEPLAISSSVGCARRPSARHWTIGYLIVVDRDVALRPEACQPAVWFPIDQLPSPRAADIDAVLAGLLGLPRHDRSGVAGWSSLA
jgi:ADP-ribose pyrophosphatase YjhB (NUDIX family)